MIRFEEFKKLSRKGNLIAISQTAPADLETPVSCFLKLASKNRHAFLLESAEQGEKTGRYSFIGLNPAAIFKSHRGKLTVERKGKTLQAPEGYHITELIQSCLEDFLPANPDDFPGFGGGFVGYLSYENVKNFETIQLSGNKKGPEAPDAIFFLTQDFVVFDHFRKTISFVSLVNTAAFKSLRAAYDSAAGNIRTLIQNLRKPLRLPAPSNKKVDVKLKSNVTPEKFYNQVRKIKSYIRAGDCIQVVLSQRFSFPNVKNDFQIYRALRSVNPSPYMFYFKSGDFRLIGSSPEMLVRKTGSEAELRPIAGTRPRGKNAAEDLKLEESLKKSKKEMAEHLMLVDLGRNDLGRVCEFNSVKVKNFARVERYSHVMHLVSDVTGKLRKNQTAFDLLRATFPAGTVSGAPKVRAMQIIDELEPEKRGPYAGSLGYFSFTGDMDMCITIRTLVADGKKIYLQAGAGIVKDSSPQAEFQETVNKARALLKAIAMQGEF